MNQLSLRVATEKLHEFRECGDWDGANELMRTWSRGRSRADQWWALTSLAIFAYSEGLFEQARICCLEMVNIDATDSFPHDLIGNMARLLGDLVTAERELQLAYELAKRENIGTFAATTDLCKVLLAQERLTECKRLAMLDCDVLAGTTTEDDPPSHIQLSERCKVLGDAYSRGGEHGTAIDYYRHAVRNHLKAKLTPLPDELMKALINSLRAMS